MSANEPEQPGVWVISIHDRAPKGYLAFDVMDVLNCLGTCIYEWLWIVLDTDLECTGEGAELLSKAAQLPGGLILSADELCAAFRKVWQTIDATLIAVPKEASSARDLEKMETVERFPETSARLIIRAVDSTFFEVMTKDVRHVQALRKCFKDVREEDPHRYFAAPSTR